MGYAIAGLYAILVGLYVPILTTLLRLNRGVGVLSKEVSDLRADLTRRIEDLAKRLSHSEARSTVQGAWAVFEYSNYR